MRGVSSMSVVSRLIRNKRVEPSSAMFSLVTKTPQISPPSTTSFMKSIVTTTNASTALAMFLSSNSFNRTLSTSSSGPSNIVLIESEEQFNNSLRKVQDESLPAVFYFTAVWCGPCRLLLPIIKQLSKDYPHVTTYKIDIDQKELGSALNKLNIHSVPTLHFFQNGTKASEVVGADVQRLKDTMEQLYK